MREDFDKVEALRQILEAAGIPVWTDKSSLGPGEDWKLKIQEAITHRALAFVACFSTNSENRPVTYQNEELILAIEQLRLRALDQAWLLPVRFDDCDLPDFRLGTGRTLNDLNRTDLFGEAREINTAKLLAAVMRILGASGQVVRGASQPQGPSSSHATGDAQAVTSVRDAVKTMLHDPQRQMALEELVMDEAARALEQLNSDKLFPTSSAALQGDRVVAIRAIVDTYALYSSVVSPLAGILATGCAWGTAEHERLWAQAVQTVGSTVEQMRSGLTVLLDLRSFALWPVLYAGGLGALSRNKYGALRAITSDAFARRDGRRWPVATLIAQHDAAAVPVAATVLVLQQEGPVADETITTLLQRGGVRFTPISDYLHNDLRPMFGRSLLSDDDYSELFDEFEVLLGLIIFDEANEARKPDQQFHRWHFGRFSWKNRWDEVARPEDRLYAVFKSQGERWGPLAAGSFGGSTERAQAAFDGFIEGTKEKRRQRF